MLKSTQRKLLKILSFLFIKYIHIAFYIVYIIQQKVMNISNYLCNISKNFSYLIQNKIIQDVSRFLRYYNKLCILKRIYNNYCLQGIFYRLTEKKFFSFRLKSRPNFSQIQPQIWNQNCYMLNLSFSILYKTFLSIRSVVSLVFINNWRFIKTINIFVLSF